MAKMEAPLVDIVKDGEKTLGVGYLPGHNLVLGPPERVEKYVMHAYKRLAETRDAEAHPSDFRFQRYQ